MSCSRFTPQNEEVESLLFDQIFDIVKNEEKADELYGYFRTDEALDVFGDYINNPDQDSIKDRTDENGEPRLEFDKVLNKYYFLDRFDERIYYPHNQGLINLFAISDIMTLREIMALKYYDTLEFDFNKRQFLNITDSHVKTIVTDFLDYKTDALKRDSDFFIATAYGNSMELSKQYIDEWVQEVKDYFSTKGLIINKDQLEKQDIEDTTDSATATREQLIAKEAFLINRKDTVNNNIKLFLSLIKSKELNKFKEYGFIPFDDIYTTLNTILANHIPVNDENGNLENIYDIFLDIIKKHSKFKPYLADLYDKIQNIDNENFKYQFINAFFLARKQFLGSDISIEKGEYTYEIKDYSEVSSRKKTILSLWTYLINKGEINLKHFHTLKNTLTPLIKSLDKTPTETTYSRVASSVIFNLTMVGVPLSSEALDYHIQITYGEELEDRVEGVKKVIRDLNMAINAFDEKTDIVTDLMNNSAFVKLASAESFFKSEGTDAAFFSAGKTKWLYSLYSHLEKTILSWQKNPNTLEKHINSSAFTKGSLYAKHFLAYDVAEEEREEVRAERINKIKAFVFNSVQMKNESIEADDNKSLFYVDSIADYMNKMFNYLKPNGKIYHKTALAAGKSTEYQIVWGDHPEIFSIQSKASKKGGTFKINKQVQDIFYEYFKSDYYRMIEVHDAIDNGEDLVPHYHTGASNGKLSQLFPSLSPTFKKGVASNPAGVPITLYDKAGRPIYEDLDVVKDQILPLIKVALQKNIESTIKTLEEANISYYTINGFRKFQGLDKNILDFYMGSARKFKKNLTEEEKNKRKAKLESGFFEMAADFTVNSIISQVEYSKLISGDVAYYKDIVDYKKRISATYTDGQYLTLLENEERYFNAAIIDSVEFTTPNIKQLRARLPERIWKQYESVNAADAQAWITPERWYFIMKRLGKGNEALPIFTKMYEENPQFTPTELTTLAQPLKGVYFSNTSGKPVYLKYSQAVLLPRLIQNTPLEKLYDQMVEDKIDELITLDGIKVGSITPTVTHNEDGSIKDNIVFTPMQLSNAHWKLQQDLPTKGIKPRELGSQIQKNIFQGLAYNLLEDFYIEDQKISGKELIIHINDLFGSLSNKGTQKLLNQLGIDDGFKITNEDGLYHNLLEQFKSRTGVSKNVINALQARTAPFGIPGSYSIFQNVFSSLSSKNTIKIKTNGGGFIQMADYGLSKSEAKKQGIIFTPWFSENEEMLSPPVIGINPVTGKEIIQPGGIFLSGSMIAKHIPNYAKMNTKQLFGTLNEETGKYEGGKIDEKILRNIIGYRIPNQALSSNDALQVMGILPEEIGDTVIAYTGITEKTGSDFDIDKMYLMVPSFKAHYSTKKDNNPYRTARNYMADNEWTDDKVRQEIFKIGEAPSGNIEEDWNTIAKFITEDSEYEYFDSFRQSSNVKSARRLEYIEADPDLSLDQQSNDVLQNKLIEAYKAVLTHPKVYEQLMNPIEVPHIKHDIKSLIPVEETEDLLNFSSINDLQVKSNLMVGKTGLGQVINYLTDSVRGSMGELHFVEDGFTWGHKTKQGESKLDERFSEKLTTEEKREYVESFNANLPKGVQKLTMKSMKNLEELEITESFMGLVNGFVDIEKDEYIVKGNWTTKTNSLGLSLLRSGSHPFKINAFLAQPVLKEYMKFSDTLNSKNIKTKGNIEHLFKLHKFHETFKNKENVATNGEEKNFYKLTKKIFSYYAISKIKFYNQAQYTSSVNSAFENIKMALYKEFDMNVNREDDVVLDEVIESYRNTFNEYFNAPSIDLNEFSLLQLRNQVLEESDNETQIGIFEIFLEWQKKARQVNKVVSVNKADVNASGKNITSAVVSLNLADEVINGGKEGEITGYDTLLNFEGRPTIMNYSLVNGLSLPFKIMQANPKFFPTASPVAIRTFNMVSRFMEQNSLNDDFLGDQLEKSYYSYLMGGFKPFNITNTERIDLIVNMPAELLKMKEEYSDNLLVNELGFEISPVPNKFYISMSSNNKTASKKNDITDAWADLLEQEPEFAERLIKYSFIESSFSNSISQFHEFIPYQWFNKNRLNSYLKGLELNAYEVDFNFIDQFFRNHIDMDKIGLKLNSRNSGPSSIDPSGEYLRVGPIINPKNEKFIKYIAYEEDSEVDLGAIFDGNPFSDSPSNKYFKFIGIDQNNRPIYVRTTPLGIKDKKNNKIKEFSIGTLDNSYGLQSIFPANVSSYLVKQNINIKSLEALSKSESNYILPKARFYDNLDTLPIEAIDIADTTETVVTKKASVVKEGVSEVFKDNPKLDNIGTEQQYSEYLDSVFPDSKVKDIAYHGTKGYDGSGKEVPKFEKFDKSLIGKKNGLRSDDMAKGFYFGSYKIADRVGTRILPVILNIEEENNTTVRRNTRDFDTKGDVFVVFEPEQIHILGSKQDIQGFKEFTSQQSSDVGLGTETVVKNISAKAGVKETKEELLEYIESLDRIYFAINVVEDIQGDEFFDADKALEQAKEYEAKGEFKFEVDSMKGLSSLEKNIFKTIVNFVADNPTSNLNNENYDPTMITAILKSTFDMTKNELSDIITSSKTKNLIDFIHTTLSLAEVSDEMNNNREEGFDFC
tara:strand:- start:11646 stop:19385 length:7740 start_codon:yes stop_codon:yes gene_type:complete